jgi:hypothetical protein
MVVPATSDGILVDHKTDIRLEHRLFAGIVSPERPSHMVTRTRSAIHFIVRGPLTASDAEDCYGWQGGFSADTVARGPSTQAH